MTRSTGGGRANTWDSQNRLVDCAVTGKTLNFTYGPDGLRRRMSVTQSGTTNRTDFLLDGQKVVQEFHEVFDQNNIITRNGSIHLNRKIIIYIVCACAVAAAGIIVWRQCCHAPSAKGGTQTANPKVRSKDPLQPAVDAYNKGRYGKAEAEANRVIKACASSKDTSKRRKAVEARYVLAFCAAKRKDMREAGRRFAILKQEAAKLPDKGKQAPMPGAVQPTLEEEGAYQHAVCTAASGDKKAAEGEYMAFIRDYPESPLTGQAVQRVSMLHGGKTVPAAEAAWKKADQIAQARAKARHKAQEQVMSACGPECPAIPLPNAEAARETSRAAMSAIREPTGLLCVLFPCAVSKRSAPRLPSPGPCTGLPSQRSP